MTKNGAISYMKNSIEALGGHLHWSIEKDSIFLTTLTTHENRSIFNLPKVKLPTYSSFGHNNEVQW